MQKYETIIHIINEGDNRFDAGDIAGAVIDDVKIMDGMILYCEPTRLYSNPLQSVVASSPTEYLVEA